MVVVVFAQVIFRFFIQQPLSWSEEVARYVFVWIIWMGAAVVVKDGHPGMDFLTKLFPRMATRDRGCLWPCCIWRPCSPWCSRVWPGVGRHEPTLPAMELPMGIPYAAIPIAAVIMLLNLACYVFFPRQGSQQKEEIDKWASG